MIVDEDAVAGPPDPSTDSANENQGIEVPSYPSALMDKICEGLLMGDVESTQILWKKLLAFQKKLFHSNVDRLAWNVFKPISRQYDNAPETAAQRREAVLFCLNSLVDMGVKELRHLFLQLAELYDIIDCPDEAKRFIDYIFSLHNFTLCLDQKGTNDLLKMLFGSKYRVKYCECIPTTSEKGAEIIGLLHKVDNAILWLQNIDSALQTNPLDTASCLIFSKQLQMDFVQAPPSVQSRTKHYLVGAFKKIKLRRTEPGISREDVLELSRAMLYLNEALRKRQNFDNFQRFNDLYDFHECIRLQPELLREQGIQESIQSAIVEARSLGERLLESEWFRQWLDKNPRRKGDFYSQLGEICRAHREYECVAPSKLPPILELAIDSFQKALSINNPPLPIHMNYDCPRIAECQRYLGRYDEAIESYRKVIDPGNGITYATAWEARKNIAECYHTFARIARSDEENELAKQYFFDAENWFLKPLRFGNRNST